MIAFDWSNIHEIASALIGSERTTWDLRGSEGDACRYDVGDRYGEGLVEYYRWPEGFSTLVLDARLRLPTFVTVKDRGNVRLNFAISLDGCFEQAGGQRDMGSALSWRLINSKADAESIEKWNVEGHNTYVTIHCPRSWLVGFANASLADLPASLHPLDDAEQSSIVVTHYQANVLMLDTLLRLLSCQLNGHVRMSYVKAQTVELACLALDCLLDDRSKNNVFSLAPAEKAAISEMGTLIKNDVHTFGRVADLAKRLAMNRNKVFYGFQGVFGMSPSKFIETARIERAYHLLARTNQPMSEVANQAGFAHQSSLSTAVKRAFGCSPSKLRNLNK